MAECVLIPTVSWAQRKDFLYLKVKVPEHSKPEIKITEDSLALKCSDGAGKIYQLDIKFLKHVDPSQSKHGKIGNYVEMTIRKADCEASYWPRLVVSQDKQHWLRVDYNRWKDEEESESEDEIEDTDDEETEDIEEEDTEDIDEYLEKMAKLNCNDEAPQFPRDPSSWSEGLTGSQQQEWLVDCFRLRVNDECTWAGNIRPGLPYNECNARDLVQDFLLFCRLAMEQGVIPQVWSWPGFLTVAGRLLPFSFEKSEAKEKYGSENVFQAAMGGRSLRYTGELVYGSSHTSDEDSELYSKLEEELLDKKRTPAMIKGMAGKREWNILELEVAKQLRKMYGEL